ncbi:MAG: efflux RND transporter periplasmic adaptor subunit [Treponema sp.]|nr:efflux RND transporter periplasmic adaptor subunit [Treponema sp.]
MKKTTFLPAACALLAGLLLAACNRGAGEGDGAQAAPSAPVFAVNTTLAERGPIQDFIGLSGDVIASAAVDAFAEAAGRVEQVFVTIGQQVSRGQAIAVVDPSRPGMTFQPHTVTAPVAGTIVALPAQVGMTISQAVPLARIASGGALEIRLFVAERFISRMAPGLPAEITLAAWPGEVFHGRIVELSPTLDPISRTMEIRVGVENHGGRLRAGMFATARLITERKENVVKIPSTAMITRFGGQYVYVVEADAQSPGDFVARRRSIVPGIMVDGMLEVQSGLAPDEEVVARGQSLLEDGARVNVIERLAPIGSGAAL